MSRLILGGVLMLVLAALAPAAHADVKWLCHPGTTNDPCESPLDTTVIAPNGAESVVTPSRVAQRRRPVDCFYVYPTVSGQPTPNATKARDPELEAVAKAQASRFSPLCRMFAPLYRQVTVGNLAGNVQRGGAIALAYGDVREAFKRYLAHDNGGRGFILISHSQGTTHLRQLIRTQIDPHPSLRRRFVGGFLLGGNVTTAAGSLRGGDFKRISLCAERGDVGCVLAYSTFSTDPGPSPVFGNSVTDALSNAFGEAHGAGYEVACTDPEVLSGSSAPVPITAPASGGQASTTWLSRDRYAGGCRTINGAHVLRYHPVGASPAIPEFLPGWGTHLDDVNLGVDRLVRIGGIERRGWLRRELRVRRHGRRLVVRVPGAGTVRIGGAKSVRVHAPRTLSRRVPRGTRVVYRPDGDRPIGRRG